jgi:NADPH:quinone reductase-like Zn-dependent oxidoreductase
MKIIMRFVLGFTKPRKPILGTVFSGIVVQIGKEVKGFKIGDEVFGSTGFKFGTYAEYITLSEKDNVILKPKNASFEEAAAIPFGGQTALYFLQKAKITKKINPKVLIYGATGAVGTAAIQIVKYYNGEITAVCSTRGKNMLEDLGITNIILYDKEDFTKFSSKFDIIFDAVGKTSKKQCLHLLDNGGIYKTVESLEIATETKGQLEFLCNLFESGKYNVAIDKIYPLTEIVEAHRYVDTGRKKGNVILRVSTK